MQRDVNRFAALTCIGQPLSCPASYASKYLGFVALKRVAAKPLSLTESRTGLSSDEGQRFRGVNHGHTAVLQTMVATEAPAVSVVFISYNSADFLSRALDSLVSTDARVTYETIVVDNASRNTVRLRDLSREYGVRLLLLGRNVGYGAAANRGAKLARGRYLAIANPDIRFSGDVLFRLVESLDNSPQVGVAGPQLVYPDGRLQPSARRYPRLRYALAGRRSPLIRLCPAYSMARRFLYQEVESARDQIPVEAVIGTFMVMRREAYEEVGGFDERYFMFAEDMDLCRRMRRQGWGVVLVPNARLEHYYGGVRRRFRRLTEYHRIKGLCRFLCDGRPLSGRFFIVLASVGYLGVVEAAGLLGLQEYEYSWHRRER